MKAYLRSLIGMAMLDRPMFVIISLAVNMMLVVRSYVTMQVLDYRELGLAALLQSVVLLIGALQFGFLNGGYRLLCSAADADASRVNNLVFTFIGVLSIVALAAVAASLPFFEDGGGKLVAVLGVLGGVATLGRTWMMNHMIAREALPRLNRINLASGLASVAVLVFIPVDPLIACLTAVVAHPVVFVAAAAMLDRNLLPTRIEASPALIRTVLNAGFMMFLMGVFLQINMQMERWYVTAFLGLDTLGHLYLAILFVTLFQMVPVSLDQIFLPAIVRAHTADDVQAARRGMRQFFLLEVAYCLVAALAVGLLAGPIIELVLPRYTQDLRYIYLLMPGLILLTLSGPFGIAFNVLIRYRYYFLAYGGGTAATVLIFLWGASSGGLLSLDLVILVRSMIYALMAVVIVMGYLALTQREPGLRFNPLQRPKGRP
jgi:O-antigen/teichoic acid export membrane protein